MEVSFYHLTHSPLDKALPRLLEKVVASKLRAVVLTDTHEKMQDIDTLLWTYSQSAFLAHGTCQDPYPEHQPIYVTTSYENPNEAQVLVVTDGFVVQEQGHFNRCLDLFNGLDEEAVSQTRERWKDYKNLGYKVVYWRQDDAGSWKKMSF
jgi:DNA polymerase-3 subunit chi